MSVRVKIIEVTEHEPAGVPNLSVHLDELIENLLGNSNIIAIILRRDPQAQNFGPRLLDHVLRRDNVPGRLRHLLALPIENKTVGQDSLVWGAMVGDDAGQQGTVEPAPMLVRPFEVEIVRPPLPSFQDRGVTNARLEPHVKDVSLLFECRPATFRTTRAI